MKRFLLGLLFAVIVAYFNAFMTMTLLEPPPADDEHDFFRVEGNVGEELDGKDQSILEKRLVGPI